MLFLLARLFMATSATYLLILLTQLIWSILLSDDLVHCPLRIVLFLITIIVTGWLLCYLAMSIAKIPFLVVILLML